MLRAFPRDEPTKKRFVNEMIAWSAKAGDYPNGDPELHHVAGTLFAEGMSILSRFVYLRHANVPFSPLQKAMSMTLRDILLWGPRTQLNNSPKSNMTGTCKMILTPPPSMLLELSFPIF